jgi:hypothetical protein
MKTLIITDLARTEELGRDAMAAVRGGFKIGEPSYPYPPMGYSPSSNSPLKASQSLQQFQQVINETADGSAYLEGVHATNTTSQFGQNNLIVG